MATSESDPNPDIKKDSDISKPSQPAAEPPAVELHQHHVSNILDEALGPPVKTIKHPLVLDLFLSVSLLVAMGGFTIGLFKMYLTHCAQQSITQHNYQAAIAILKGAPLPHLFIFPGSDSDEMLNKALYLDAMDKLENENDIDSALNQLQQIQPGSPYFALAQEIINENFQPSSTTLKLGVEKTESHPVKAEKPFHPEYPKDATP